LAGAFALDSVPQQDSSGDPLLQVHVNGELETEGVHYDFDGTTGIQWRAGAPFILEENDVLSHRHLPVGTLAIYDREAFTLTAGEVAASQVTLKTPPIASKMGVYYDGGAKATQGVDYNVVGATVSWISPTAWIEGNELQIWYVAA